ncbi:MAG: glycosyltransferase, partial [Nitrospira sp. CG24E]
MMLAPIALFAYNRPNHLRQTVEALRAARQARLSRLFVFCDGAKRSQDRDAVEQVRYYARTIEGFASVTVVEWERNLGLAVSITEG